MPKLEFNHQSKPVLNLFQEHLNQLLNIEIGPRQEKRTVKLIES